jgi:SAM-dependent methyltransferase
MTQRDDDRRGADLARYYDLDLLDDPGDLDMYLALAATSDGAILELAGGSGRLAVPLAAAGHDLTAVDRDPRMLARALTAWKAGGRPEVGRRKGAGKLTLLEHDLTTLRLKRRFDLVLIALNTLLLLDGRAAQARALNVMRAHLALGGRAVVDVWLPTPDDLALYDGRQVLDWVRHDPETGEWVAKTSSARYSPGSQTATVTTLFDAWRDGSPARRTMRRDAICFIGASELLALAAGAGLSAETIAGDYDMTPLSDESDRIVLVARAAPA